MTDLGVKKLLDQHKSLILDESTQKIKCSLTNHEMPAKVGAIETYIKGRKYKRLADLAALSYEEHKTHIAPNKKREHEMFCRLTLRHLEKTASAIHRHINGKKYKNALARWKECQETGKKFVAMVSRSAKRPKESDDDLTSNGSFGDEEVLEDSNMEDSEAGEEDDMSDLYPPADFPEESDSDFEFNENGDEDDDEVEEDVKETPSTNNRKRKNKGKVNDNVPNIKKKKSNDETKPSKDGGEDKHKQQKLDKGKQQAQKAGKNQQQPKKAGKNQQQAQNSGENQQQAQKAGKNQQQPKKSGKNQQQAQNSGKKNKKPRQQNGNAQSSTKNKVKS